MTHRTSFRPAPGLVAALTYDGRCTFEFGIAVEVFGLPGPEFDFPWYDFCGSRPRGTGRALSEASSLRRQMASTLLEYARTIIIPGWRDRTDRPPERLLQAIVRASNRNARCLSICSGVFVLAAAGLLDGKRATTHWRHMADLKRMYPEIDVDEDMLYVNEDNVITSAGSSAGIDACLDLVRRDLGSKVANTVARRLVMPPHRDGKQAQYIAAPVQEPPGRMGAAMDWARKSLAKPLDVKTFAKWAAMSERTFLRRFRESVGLSPADWLQHERMCRARELLEVTDTPSTPSRSNAAIARWRPSGPPSGVSSALLHRPIARGSGGTGRTVRNEAETNVSRSSSAANPLYGGSVKTSG